jgi:hypothetical protein
MSPDKKPRKPKTRLVIGPRPNAIDGVRLFCGDRDLAKYLQIRSAFVYVDCNTQDTVLKLELNVDSVDVTATGNVRVQHDSDRKPKQLASPPFAKPAGSVSLRPCVSCNRPLDPSTFRDGECVDCSH